MLFGGRIEGWRVGFGGLGEGMSSWEPSYLVDGNGLYDSWASRASGAKHLLGVRHKLV